MSVLADAQDTRFSSSRAQQRGRRWYAFLSSALPLAVLLALWEAVSTAGLVDTRLLPPPHEVLRELAMGRSAQALRLGYAQTNAAWYIVACILGSLGRVVVGIAIGFVVGFSLGLLLAVSARGRRMLYPVVRTLAPISPVAWIPVAMMLLGIGNGPAVLVVTLSVVFLITVATVASVQSIDPALYNAARTLGARSWKMLGWVVIPAALPGTFATLRLNAFAAWMSVLVAEMVGVADGLGAMLMVGRALFNMKLVLGAMMLIGLSGFLLDAGLSVIERRLLWWRDEVRFT